jgi:hypothetical protein
LHFLPVPDFEPKSSQPTQVTPLKSSFGYVAATCARSSRHSLVSCSPSRRAVAAIGISRNSSSAIASNAFVKCLHSPCQGGCTR